MKILSTANTGQFSRLTYVGHVLMATWTLAAMIATATNSGLVQLMEAQAQTLFFEVRGPVAPPDNIVILAIDEPSLTQEQVYRTNPQKYAYLEPLKAWPWQRRAYAQVIERLMAAGVRSVAIDVIFDTPSIYGLTDDEQLQKVLQRYAGRVTLAALYEQATTRYGDTTQLTQPNRQYWTQPLSVGSANFPLEKDDKVHRLSSEFTKILTQAYQEQIHDFDALKVAMPSFDEAVLRAAQENFPKAKGDTINFYGPARTFEHISFYNVLDPDNWNTYLQQGKYLKDKIVIIGSTAKSQQDFHPTPFYGSWLYSDTEEMSGVEIHANAIATLMQGRVIRQAIEKASLRSFFVLLGVAAAGVLLSKPKQGLFQLATASGIIVVWIGISYLSFVYAQSILPTAIPVAAIALGGLSYLMIGAASEQVRKRNLRHILKRHVSSPLAQEIISQQDEFQDLLPQELATFGKIISGRYKIVDVLGSGGFSETYIAEDTQRPGNPLCVVKQLRLGHKNSKHLQLSRRLFQLEAETLEKLGTHDQIPRLLASFAENEKFYLVQELIVGHTLSLELLPGKPIPEAAVVQILQDLLEILEFVHTQGVIHRDIKPSNIIRRSSDGKLVLIDFGAVKEVASTQTNSTIPIGTQGYAPKEQCAGCPNFTSDIYAVGMIGIKALTGLAPHELELASQNEDVIWIDKAQVSAELATIISKMVCYDSLKRYQSASEALYSLKQFAKDGTHFLPLNNLSTKNSTLENLDRTTTPWVDVSKDLIGS